MEWAHKYLQIKVYIKVNGKPILQKDKESIMSLMETDTLENMNKTNVRGKECKFTLTEANILEIGLKTKSMAKDLFIMVLQESITKANGKMALEMVMDNIIITMEIHIKDISLITKNLERES